LILLAAAFVAALALARAWALSCSIFSGEIVGLIGALAVGEPAGALPFLPGEPAGAPPFFLAEPAGALPFFLAEPAGAPPACGEPVGVVGVAPVVRPLGGDVEESGEESEPQPTAARARQPTAARIASDLSIPGIIAFGFKDRVTLLTQGFSKGSQVRLCAQAPRELIEALRCALSALCRDKAQRKRVRAR
jgi:hypothetical protein